MRRIAGFVAAVAMLAVLAGCGTPLDMRLRKAEYWERADIRESVQLGAVRAQTMLNRDIARCVVDIKEQERMAAVREAMPADGRGIDPAAPAGRLAGWDTPERDGYLRAEHLPYHDFESCMTDKGWVRIAHVPPARAARARDAWVDHAQPGARSAAAAKRKAQAETARGGSAAGNNGDYSYFNF